MAGYLEGKVAVVTGAGRGIGRGVALEFARQGARVVVNDPGVALDGSGGDPGPADAVVAEVAALGGQAVASYASVATMEGGEAVVRQALEAFGRLDIVATPHGILRDRMVFNMSEEEWDEVIRVHLKGTFCVVRHAAVVFRQQRAGRIITFSSESGLVGNTGQANYGAAKSGIAGFTKVVARDLGRYGVTANAVAPRAFTRMTAAVPDASRLPPAGGLDVGSESWRRLDPDDVAPFVAFLASDHAQHVNGQTFLVYGGVVALMGQPRPVRSAFKEGRWTVEELDRVCREYLTEGLVNPAPPQGART